MKESDLKIQDYENQNFLIGQQKFDIFIVNWFFMVQFLKRLSYQERDITILQNMKNAKTQLNPQTAFGLISYTEEVIKRPKLTCGFSCVEWSLVWQESSQRIFHRSAESISFNWINFKCEFSGLPSLILILHHNHQSPIWFQIGFHLFKISSDSSPTFVHYKHKAILINIFECPPGPNFSNDPFSIETRQLSDSRERDS